jgi:hypothetical protein
MLTRCDEENLAHVSKSMSLKRKSRALFRVVGSFCRHPSRSVAGLVALREAIRGRVYSERWTSANEEELHSERPKLSHESRNPLREYFDAHHTGRGIWKWTHYFEIYHRHFQKFIGRDVAIVEVGVFSGGSLEMWKQYLGPRCSVYGIDIEPACKVYEDDRTKIFIGDQADRRFWQTFREQVPQVDILVDDGGHLPEQQIVTLEEILPHLRPGGVYMCEDIHGADNRFAAYVAGLASSMHTTSAPDQPGDGVLTALTAPFQRDIHSIHLYPFVAVVEKREVGRDTLVAPRHGTEWQPFL